MERVACTLEGLCIVTAKEMPKPCSTKPKATPWKSVATPTRVKKTIRDLVGGAVGLRYLLPRPDRHDVLLRHHPLRGHCARAGSVAPDVGYRLGGGPVAVCAQRPIPGHPLRHPVSDPTGDVHHIHRLMLACREVGVRIDKWLFQLKVDD